MIQESNPSRPTKRIIDLQESVRSTAGIILASSFFYISIIIHARPRAANANCYL